MARLVLRKLVHLIPVLFLVSTATFFMLELIPGDPAAAVLGADAAPEDYERVRSQLGVDKPVLERYGAWLGDVVRGDLGESVLPPTREVRSMVSASLPVTIQLALLATGMALLLAIPAALYAAYTAGRRFDRTANGIAYGFISVPTFLAALLLVHFAVLHPDILRWSVPIVAALGSFALARRVVRRASDYSAGRDRTRYLATAFAGIVLLLLAVGVLLLFWPTFPRQGFVRLTSERGVGANVRHAFLPALTLAIAEAAVFMRLLRNDLVTTLQEDHILAAKAKGLPPWRVLVLYALRPSSFSLITVAGVSLGRLIGGTVIVEAVFNLPGMGTMIVEAIRTHDYRVVQGGVLVIAAFYVAINALIDISYAYLDPRIRRD